MTLDAAVGSRSILGRGVEKIDLGLPQGPMEFINFDAVDISRESEENPATAITGSAGLDKGTPAALKTGNKLTYDLTASRLVLDLAGMLGIDPATAITNYNDTAYLIKFRPAAEDNELRGISMYLYEGGSYSASFQTGRRVPEVQLTTDANKRVKTAVTYSQPTGDTISGFALVADGNTGTEDVTRIGTRGRRPFDAFFTAGKSLIVYVVSRTATSAVLKAGIFDATPGDGTGFPVVGDYGAETFTVYVPDQATGKDGYSVVINSQDGVPIGLFGENFEPLELTFGNQVLTTFAVADQFEFTATLPALTKTTNPESRLSGFHLLRTIGGTTDIRIESGTITLSRPYKEYYANGKRLPQAIDPTGPVTATATFKKRLFDRYFRNKNDAHDRFTLYDVMRVASPVTLAVADEEYNVASFAGDALIADTLAGGNIVPGSLSLFDESTPVQTVTDDGNGNIVGTALGTGGTATVNYTTGAISFSFTGASTGPQHATYQRYTDEVAYEGVEIFIAQCGVTNFKSGDVSSRDVLSEDITLMAEQPSGDVTLPSSQLVPSLGDTAFDQGFAFQINILTLVPPQWITDAG